MSPADAAARLRGIVAAHEAGYVAAAFRAEVDASWPDRPSRIYWRSVRRAHLEAADRYGDTPAGRAFRELAEETPDGLGTIPWAYVRRSLLDRADRLDNTSSPFVSGCAVAL